MISVSEEAKRKLFELRSEGKIAEDYFLRVSVVGGGCSGLSYKMDFDNEIKDGDQVFPNGVECVNAETVTVRIKSPMPSPDSPG